MVFVLVSCGVVGVGELDYGVVGEWVDVWFVVLLVGSLDANVLVVRLLVVEL